MKRNLLLVLIMISSVAVFGQLTTRTNDASKVKFGARPEAGDNALTFGVDIANGQTANLYGGNLLQAGNLLTFKCYQDNGIAYRGGIRLYKKATTMSGEYADSSAIYDPGLMATEEVSEVESQYLFVPGIEKHFNASNFFDVYIGGDVMVGLGKNKMVNNNELTNGDYSNLTVTSSNAVFGLGGVVGFNVFLAHLPVSIGMEYGLNAKWSSAGKDKVKLETKVSGDSETYEYYMSDYETGTAHYTSLTNRQFGMDTNQNVRIVLNIYFSRD